MLFVQVVMHACIHIWVCKVGLLCKRLVRQLTGPVSKDAASSHEAVHADSSWPWRPAADALTVQRAHTVFGFISPPSTTDTQTHLISLFYYQCPFRTCLFRMGWLWYCSFLTKRLSKLLNTPHWLYIKTLTLKLIADSWLGMSSVLREKANPNLSLHGSGCRQCRAAPN